MKRRVLDPGVGGSEEGFVRCYVHLFFWMEEDGSDWKVEEVWVGRNIKMGMAMGMGVD